MGSPKNQQHPSDIVWGAKAIGEVINRSERETYWLLENGLLPAAKIGKLWTGSRARLLARVSGEDAS